MPKLKKNFSVYLNVRLTPKIAKALENQAIYRGVTRSELVRQLLGEQLKERATGKGRKELNPWQSQPHS